jgi:hypothetical protein
MFSWLQLQPLDLIIRKKDLAVPLDTAPRSDLIDLMARVLFAPPGKVVFRQDRRVTDNVDLPTDPIQARLEEEKREPTLQDARYEWATYNSPCMRFGNGPSPRCYIG